MGLFPSAGRPLRRTVAGRAADWGALLLSLLAVAVTAVALAQEGDDRPAAEPSKGPSTGPTEKPTVAGRLIRVRLPIEGNDDNRIKAQVQRALAAMELGGERPVLILELAADGTEGGAGSDFTRALSLARFLSSRELAGVKTVAYLPATVRGHAVLVAMSCEEIVMAPDAELGPAGDDQPPEPAVVSGYDMIARRRQTLPLQVALGLLDPRLEVLKVETDVSIEYVFREDLAELQERAAVQESETLFRPGEPGRFSGREGRTLGLVKYLAADRESVARALSLPAEALADDPSLDGAWEPVRLTLKGRVGARSAGRLKQMLDKVLQGGEVNFICLEIDSPGGSLESSIDLSNNIARLDPGAVRTVAYVPREARADAALVALACDDLVMSEEASLGGSDRAEWADDEIDVARQTVRDSLAPEKRRNWSLMAALVDPALEVRQCRHAKTGRVAYFSTEELAAQQNPDDWIEGELVTRADETLTVDAARAAQLGLARDVVANFDEFRGLFGLESDPRLVEPDWSDVLVGALARPEVAAMLMLIGLVGLWIELNAPGIGIGGFVATVCFLVFFWSKFLDGTANWLEVMLFLGGFCCLLLEIFVIPGFGIFGLGGGLMIIASLVLASQTFVLPRSDADMLELRNSLLVVGAAGAGSVAGAVMLRRYLPHAPMFNRLMLTPPVGDDGVVLADRESVTHYEHLVGRRGETATQLTPSGKAHIDDALVDVIADGEVIDRGVAIEVVDVRGNRVLVRSVESS